MKNYIKYFGILALGMVACEPEFENPVNEAGTYTSGEANFSNFVAVGNSLTAGYADNALYITGQQNSFPNILAQQFALVGGGAFTQPLMADNAGGLLLNGTQITGNRRVLAIGADGPSPAVYGGTSTTEVTNKLTGPFNNMGTPGAKSFHLLAPNYGNVAGVATGMANPYFARFASTPEATIIADAVAQDPTFFSLWIGNNDVLGFATSGGAGVDQTGNMNPGSYASNDITDPQVFASVYSQLVNQLVATGADGILTNIPNVTDVPFFTTVPVNPIPLDEATAAMLNGQFAGYNQQILPGLAQMGVITAAEMQQRQINFAAGQNFVTLVDEDLTDLTQILQGPPFSLDAATATMLGQLRQATNEDLIPLTTSTFLGTLVDNNPTLINGVSVPLGDQHVLTEGEQVMIATATAAYNATIKALADEKNLAFLDANTLLSQLSETGIPYDGGMLTATFASGGAFSLDGVHLTPRGYALVANEMIDAINETYHASVPKVNIGAYPTVTPSNNVQ